MALIPTTAAPTDYRRRLAYELMKEGADPSVPVQHWAQGLAKLGQGALGGYELYQADQKDKEDEMSAAKAYAALLQGGAATPAPPMPTTSQPSAPATGPMVGADPTAVTAPRPGGPVMPSNKVWGDAEAEAAGIYEPSSKNVKMASALAAPELPVAAPVQKPGPQVAQALTTPSATPAVDPTRAKIIQLLQSDNAAERKMGRALAENAIATQLQGNKPTDDIREFEYGQKNPAFNQWTLEKKRAGAIQNNVVIDQKGELEFSKTAGKKQAERFDELAADGQSAKQMISDVKTLTELGKNIGTGKTAEAKAIIGPYAEALGIKVDGLSEIQAFEAIVNRVAPSLRVKGSGAQSDFELKNFLKSLPNLGNTPEGNAIAGKTIEGLYENKVRAAEIAGAALAKRITPEQAEKMIRELPDHMAEYRDYLKKARSPAGSPAKSNLKQKYGLD